MLLHLGPQVYLQIPIEIKAPFEHSAYQYEFLTKPYSHDLQVNDVPHTSLDGGQYKTDIFQPNSMFYRWLQISESVQTYKPWNRERQNVEGGRRQNVGKRSREERASSTGRHLKCQSFSFYTPVSTLLLYLTIHPSVYLSSVETWGTTQGPCLLRSKPFQVRTHLFDAVCMYVWCSGVNSTVYPTFTPCTSFSGRRGRGRVKWCFTKDSNYGYITSRQ